MLMTRPGKNTDTLPQIAKKFRALEKKDIRSLIEKGRLLQVAFDREDHGDREEYHSWVADELDISTSQEARYRNVFAFSEISQSGKFGEQIKIADLNISRTALYELANEWDAYPAGIVAEVLRMASTSPVTLARVNTIFDEYRDACRAAAAEAGVVDDEPEPELDVGEPEAEDGPGDEPDAEVDADDAEPDADDADEPEADEPPPANELSMALETIANHSTFSPLWGPTVKLIDRAKLLSIIETLNVVSYLPDGKKVDGALKLKADRAEARSRARRAADEPTATILAFPEREDA
jgi:hypothetical protein